jgi:hypothetical protein
VGPADLPRVRLGQPQEPDLAGGDQVGHGADGLLDRRLGVDAVLIIEIDRLDAEARQAAVAARADIVGLAVDAEPAPSGARITPNLVAITASSRRPASALPTRTSLVWGPYMSAVSKKFMP